MMRKMSSFDVKDEGPAKDLNQIAEKLQQSKHLTTVEQKNVATEFLIQEWEASK